MDWLWVMLQSCRSEHPQIAHRAIFSLQTDLRRKKPDRRILHVSLVRQFSTVVLQVEHSQIHILLHICRDTSQYQYLEGILCQHLWTIFLNCSSGA